MNCFHIQRVAENEIDRDLLAKISDPIPAMHAFDANNYIANIRFKKPVKLFGIGRDFFMYYDVTVLILIEPPPQPAGSAVSWMATKHK